MSLDGYLPIADHGLIGNHHTVALVGVDGTIDWYCCPRFDSPSVFGAILDKDKGGYFRISSGDENARKKQFYFPDTNVLITRFFTPDGVGEVTDFMPVDRPGELSGRHRLIRWVHVVRGQMTFDVEVEPRFDYGRARHVTHVGKNGVVFETPELTLALSTTTSFERTRAGVRTSLTLSAGETATFVVEPVEEAEVPRPCSPRQTEELVRETVAYWRAWLAQSNYRGRWREMVQRSALTLKLLTYKPTGAIVAAPTTSLPEQIGGQRNWDYRYTWLRDSAFSLHALLLLGFKDAAEQFIDWLTDRFQEVKSGDVDRLQVMYRVDGSSELDEEELDHFEGYCGSGPVRVGNGAATQLQLDIYGELIDAIYVYNKYGGPIYYDAWDGIRSGVDRLCEEWDQPGRGHLGDARGAEGLRVLAAAGWVGIDRAARMAVQRSLPADVYHWRAVGPHPCADPRARVEREEEGLRPALRIGRARRLAADDAAGQVRRTDRPTLDVDARRDHEGARDRQPRPPVQPRGLARRTGRDGGDVLDVLVLAGGGDVARGTGGRRPAHVREDAHVREPRRPVLGADRADR